MKKYVLMVFTIFLFGFIDAQEKTDLAFGFKAGLNISDFRNANDSKPLVGFQTGFFGEFKFKDNFSVQPELLYSRQGAKFNEVITKLDYFTIPVMAKYYFGNTFDVEVGPQVGFLLSAKRLGEDIRDSFKTTDIGINLGLGYSVIDNLTASIRYNLGLSYLQGNRALGESKYENSVFQFSLGYKFY